MNISALNHWGESFLSFAWPMLWQSSLLIVVVFALDYLLARRVRAAIRHALWMVVLLKLLLPPALALPTGAAWWLWPAKPAMTPVIETQTVSYDLTPLPENFVPQTVPLPVPPPKLSGAGWLMLASGTVSAGFLLSLLYNWLKVERKARRAASGDFVEVMEEARQLAGLRGPRRLRLVDDAISPVVYGLFRPVILLPRALAKKLSVRQLRAVLLHETMHLQRGDVWVNCAQTLLQIAYWWHPLLWLANARIRRLREEAVDDSVMVALCGDADAYAPTLLEVAKFAFRRPLASLGLVGILESRSALRQRVERLVDFRPPRRAGVTFLSLCGIILFGAVTLPMGQAPASQNQATFPMTETNPPQASTLTPVNTPSAVTSAGVTNKLEEHEFNPATVTNKLEMRTFKVNAALLAFRLRVQWVPSPELSDTGRLTTNEAIITDHLKSYFQELGINLDPPKTIFFKGHWGLIFVYATPQDINVIEHAIMVMNAGAAKPSDTNPDMIVNTTTGRKDIYDKLKHIHLDTVSFQNLSLSEVIRTLHEQSQLRDPDKAGINFLFAPPAHQGTLINPATGLPETAPAVTNTATAADIQITLKLTDASLAKVLDAICLVADHPIKCSIEDYGVVFTDKDPGAVQYAMRTFKLDSKFLSTLKERLLSSVYPQPDPQTGGFSVQASDISALVREYFREQSVNLDPPKTLFFNDRLGVLFVYATPADLKVIERIVSELDDPRTPFKNVTPSSSASERKQAADAWVKVGKEFYDAGHLDEAEQDLKAALALDPENKEAQYYLNLISQTKAISESPQGSAHASHVPFLLARPRPGYPAFADEVFDPLAPHPLYQPVYAPVNPADLITNYFHISVAAFDAAVYKKTGESDGLEGFKELIAAAGVDLSPPENISIISERFGELYVLATKKHMEIILHILDGLHCTPQQVHIKARFIEVPKTYFDDQKNSIPTAVTNGGVLTESQFRKFLHQLQSQKGAQELAEPECTTLEGRQTQMRATISQDVVTNFIFKAESPTQRTASISPQTTKVETGPILDVMASVWPDGYAIDLTAIPAIIKFYGYADTRGLIPSFGTNSEGQKIELPMALPVFGVGEVTEQKALYDNQTLVLLPRPQIEFNGGMEEKYRDRIVKHIQEVENKEDKTLIVLVTVTLIDEAGNRIHSDADMSFAQTGLPPQWPGRGAN